MKRTQIYIDEDLMQILKIQSKLKSKTVSEIIRDALNEK
ncbi:MAG TPA: ribbon-helix-helix protein, CopG family [Ignavibacteria bacterium]|nr:ribbon-helix-helix protein, CopG family [Ignavibacteria bacterium]